MDARSPLPRSEGARLSQQAWDVRIPSGEAAVLAVKSAAGDKNLDSQMKTRVQRRAPGCLATSVRCGVAKHDPAADAANAAYEFMLSVRVEGENRRVAP